MPTYTISRPPRDEEQGTPTDEATDEGEIETSDENKSQERPTLAQLQPFSSMSSVLAGPRYAVLPEGQELDGWTREDFAELNDHVRHMLHSRRSKFKRAMKGFGQYVSKRELCIPTPYGVAFKINITIISPGIFGHTLCDIDHPFWSCLGTFPDWYAPASLRLSYGPLRLFTRIDLLTSL